MTTMVINAMDTLYVENAKYAYSNVEPFTEEQNENDCLSEMIRNASKYEK